MCLLQCPIILFLEKQNFPFKSVNLKEAMRLSSTHVMKMTWKQNKVRVFVSGAYRHTKHAQTWLFISEEKIIISTLDKYCAFIIVNFILYFNKCTNRLRADSLSLNCILVAREKTNTAYFYPLRKAEVSISTYHDESSGIEADWLTQFMPCRPVTGSAR